MFFSPFTKIILDTDPGGDDAFALLWLLSLIRQKRVEITAITTAAGNVSADRTFANASQLLTLGGFSQIPLGRGVAAVAGGGEDATHIHGRDGMGNLTNTLPAPSHAYDRAPASDDLIIEQLNAAPGEISLIAIAPLTNLAAAERKSPGILQKAKEVVIMGGAFQSPGNVTPYAEFNIWFDPPAAATVLQSRRDCVIVPLDVTRQLILTRDRVQAIDSDRSGGAIVQFLKDLCEFMVGTALSYRETEGVSGFLVHDAATVGYLFYPENFLFRRGMVQVETQGEWTKGQTLIDNRHMFKSGANAWVASQVDGIGFFTSFVEDLKSLLK
jgi:inosine-uridine nucleoside N-ribohydrolase